MSRVLILGATSAIAGEFASLYAARGDRLHLVGRNAAARDIVAAVDAGAEASVPSFCAAIMPLGRSAPESVFQRLPFLSGR